MLPTILSIKELTVLKTRNAYGASHKAQRIWRIVFSSQLSSYEQLDEVRSLNYFPNRGDPYKSGDQRKCEEVTVVGTDETASECLVYADYATPQMGELVTDDPLERPDEVSGDYTTESKPYFVDTLGAMVINTAGLPMNPLPTRLAGIFRFNVSGNRPIDADRPSAWAAFLYPSCCCNEAPVTIRGRNFGAKKLLVMGMMFTVESENDKTFERWSWTLGVHPNGWDEEQFESRGFMARPTPGAKAQVIYRGDPPSPVSEPWPLNEDGTAPDDPVTPPATLVRYPYALRDFSTFQFTQGL